MLPVARAAINPYYGAADPDVRVIATVIPVERS